MNDKNYIIITQNCEEAYLVSYYIAGITPLFFFIFFLSFFLPAKADKNLANINDFRFENSFKDQNSITLLKNRVGSLMYALVFIGYLYTKVFQYYPMVIVFNETTPLALDPFIYYTLIFLIVSFLLLCQLIYRYKMNLKKEELIYLSFFMFAALIIVIQFNLIGIFMSLELFSIASYLVVTGLGRKVSIEAAIKYSLTGLLATVFFLMGITFCIVNYISINLHELSIFMHYDLFDENTIPYNAICGLFFLIAIFLKLGVAPFHFWIIDVYKGTSAVTFIWLVTMSKVVLLFVLITLLEHLLYEQSIYYEYIFLGLGLLSIIIGSMGGIRQSNLKGLLAYSSIVTLGFILLPLTFYSEVPTTAVTLSIGYLVVYVFNLFSFFFFLSKFKDVSVIFNNLFEIKNIMRPNPILALGLIISLFSFMGLPPLLGFYPKIILLKALFNCGYEITVILCIVCTLFTSFFYFLIIKQLTLSKTHTYLNYKPFTFFDYIIIGFLIFMNCFIFFFFYDILDFIYTLF